MSSNYWTSTHSNYWILTRAELWAARETDLKYATPHQLYCLYIFFAHLIQKIGKRLLLRQVPIATATTYFRRFYTKNAICETNPYLVLAACLFIAAKVEETPVHIKSVVAEAKVVFAEQNIKIFPAEPHKLGEMEFYCLEDLDFHLVVFHPYRALLNICGRDPADAGRFPKTRAEEDAEVRKRDAEERKRREDEARRAGLGAGKAVVADEVGESEADRVRRLMGRGSGEGLMEIDEGTLQIAWFAINDSYRTDVMLLYPPYVIALAAVYIGFTLTAISGTAVRTRSGSQISSLATSIETNSALGLPPPPSGAAEFIASFNVSLPILFACVQDIISHYHVWEQFEPAAPRNPGLNAAGTATTNAANSNGATANGANGTAASPPTPRFTPDMCDALVRRMIEEHMVDVGHPDDAGKSSPSAGSNKKRHR